jgi:hypothetical protein
LEANQIDRKHFNSFLCVLCGDSHLTGLCAFFESLVGNGSLEREEQEIDEMSGE